MYSNIKLSVEWKSLKIGILCRKYILINIELCVCVCAWMCIFLSYNLSLIECTWRFVWFYFFVSIADSARLNSTESNIYRRIVCEKRWIKKQNKTLIAGRLKLSVCVCVWFCKCQNDDFKFSSISKCGFNFKYISIIKG